MKGQLCDEKVRSPGLLNSKLGIVSCVRVAD